MKCQACNVFVNQDEVLKCVPCGGIYHPKCLNMTVAFYKGHHAELKKSWLCPDCTNAKRRQRNDDTPARSQLDLNVNIEHLNMSCDELPADAPQDGKEEVKAAPVAPGFRTPSPHFQRGRAGAPMQDFREEFHAGLAEMRALRQEMAKLGASLAAVVSRLDGVERRMEVVEQRLDAVERCQEEANLKRSTGTLELERTVAELKQEISDRDQEALLADLDIGNLPESKGENTIHAVTVLAGRLGVSLDERDVVFAERVGPPPGESGAAGRSRVRRVVVRLSRRHLRDELLQAARVRRGLAAEGGGFIHVNERLSRPNRQLFYRVRKECNRLQWRYSWTKRGRIMARQDDGKPVFHFRTVSDLERAFGPCPASPATQ